jgi:hypothetical protein
MSNLDVNVWEVVQFDPMPIHVTFLAMYFTKEFFQIFIILSLF